MYQSFLLAVFYLSSVVTARIRVQAIKGLRGPEPDAPVPEGTTDQCTYYHTTEEGNDCKYVEEYWGISHDQFVRWNPSVKEDCSGIKPNHSYCVEVNNGGDITTSINTSASPTPTGNPVPSPTLDGTADNCDAWHFVEKGDDCGKITQRYGITMAQFKEWNKNVEDNCSGLWAQYWFCVSVEGHDATTVTSGTSPTGSPLPSPTPDDTVKNCDKFHFVAKGDTCQKICENFGITMDQLIKWNPSVKNDCSGLWAEIYYCVSIEGHSPAPTKTTSVPVPTGGPPAPTQTGIVKECTDWYVAKSGDDCNKIVAKYGNLNLERFIQWNPAVGPSCNGLWLDTAYCVGTKGNPAKPPITNPPPTGCQNTPKNPEPTQPGAICKCKKWHKILNGDSCWSLAQKYKVTEAQLKTWNAGTNCNMWLGYHVCVQG